MEKIQNYLIPFGLGAFLLLCLFAMFEPVGDLTEEENRNEDDEGPNCSVCDDPDC